VPDDHDRNLSETRRSAHDGWIVSEESITVKLYEIAKDELDIIERERSVEVSRQLYSLVRRELTVDILSDLGNLAL
jgi:chromosomal replication initiation ATPase DnaA